MELAHVVRKDAPVSDTIERLEALLDSLGFKRTRLWTRRWTAGAACHSCQVRFTNYPILFANGKGVTPDLALASGLAEFIERLQCQLDLTFMRAGNITRLAPFEPVHLRTLDEIASDAPRLMSSDFSGLAPANVGPLSCLAFVDVFGGRVVDLPFSLLSALGGSTGMAAGNTLEEALTQAICEVFERRAIRAVEGGQVRGLPTIEPGSLRVRSPVVRQTLEWLRSSGIEVRLKDASLGGIFPVLAVILTDREARTRHVSFGSDPNFDIALTRCITEAYQGTDRLFRRMAEAAGRPAFLDTFNNLEVLIGRLEDGVGSPAVEGAFTQAATNAEALSFAIDRVRKLDLRLYVRDFSLFGFPTYYAYIEQLSALSKLGDESFSSLYRHGEDVRAALFRLPRAEVEEIRRCSAVLFDEVTLSNPLIERLFARVILSVPVLSECVVSLRTLLILMLIEVGRLREARVLLDSRPIGACEQSTEESVRAALAGYLAARGARVNGKRLRADVERILGGPPAGQDARAPAGPLLLPRCESVYACPTCPTRRFCRLDEWHRLARQLRAQAKVVRQEALLDRLGT